MGVKTYSRKADGGKALTPNLKVEEFACRDGSDVILISEELVTLCLLYTSPSPRDRSVSRMPSSA